MLQPGTKVMILPHVKDEELPKLFPKGVDKVSMPSGKVYVRTTTDYWSLNSLNLLHFKMSFFTHQTVLLSTIWTHP